MKSMKSQNSTNTRLGCLVRLFVTLVFISAAIDTLAHFDIPTGGHDLIWKHTTIGRRLDEFVARCHIPYSAAGGRGTSNPGNRGHTYYYPSLVLVACAMQLVGSILYILGRPLGGVILIWFIGCVTLVMHPVWDSGESMSRMKNVSLASAILLDLLV